MRIMIGESGFASATNLFPLTIGLLRERDFHMSKEGKLGHMQSCGTPSLLLHGLYNRAHSAAVQRRLVPLETLSTATIDNSAIE